VFRPTLKFNSVGSLWPHQRFGDANPHGATVITSTQQSAAKPETWRRSVLRYVRLWLD